MEPFVLEPVERWWRCPSCDTTDRTLRYDIHTQMHICPGMNGLNVPLCEDQSHDSTPDARQVIVEREDYDGPYNHTNTISAVRTERGDGSNDVTVFAPTANLRLAQP